LEKPVLDPWENFWQYSWEMIDLHTHSLLSDGVLLPAELVQQAKKLGYQALAITDHCDASNLEEIMQKLKRFIKSLPKDPDIEVLFGVELTHLYPEQIPKMVRKARRLGAELVVVHGETLVEPVPPGTNRRAIEAGADILAHPGLITPELVRLASKKGVMLEITTRRGHCYTNGWVVQLAREYNAPLVLNTDAHLPEDLVDWESAKKIAQGAGLLAEEIEQLLKNSRVLVKRGLGRRKAK